MLSNANNCETKDRFEHGKSHGYGGALITWVLPCIHGKYDGMAKLIQYDFCHAVWVLWYSMGFVMPLLVWRWESGDRIIVFAGTRWLWTMEEMVIIRRRGSWQSVREWATLLWPIFLSFLLRDKTYGARFSNYVVSPCSYVWELRWNWTFENLEIPPLPIPYF